MTFGLLRRTVAIVALLVAGSIAAPVWSAAAPSRPLVKVLKGPPARTLEREAVFTFKARSKAVKTACKLDGRKYRPCKARVKYAGLRLGSHKFVVRARLKGRRTLFVTRRWTIVRRGTTVRPSPVASSSEAVSPTTDPVTGAPKPGARLIFSDEFDGTTVDPSRWSMYNTPGHAGNGLRRPSAFSLQDGNLVITASMQNGEIVSGGMSQRGNFTYGRVEFRVRTEPDPTGTMSGVVLTWPKDQWAPEFTENDMYETGARPNNTTQFNTFIHFGTVADWQKWTTHYVDPSQWHTIVMDWHAGLLEIFIDGRLSFSISDRAVIPDVLHHLSLQLDARAERTLARPQRMFVDYVRVYQ
jgi:hypothetical protein